MFKSLVFEYRIVSYEYFMYDMGINEATICLDNIKWTDLNFKSMMRYNIWSMYNSNGLGKNKNTIQDIMSLPWDEGTVNHTVATKQDMNEQKERTKKMEERLKQGNITSEKYM